MRNNSFSDGEWKIMKVLWRDGSASVAAIANELREETSWSNTTVFVMLKRLIASGVVRLDDSVRPQLYYPLVEKDKVVPEATASFLSRVFDGNVGMLVSSLTTQKDLSKDEISELRAILDEAEKNVK